MQHLLELLLELFELLLDPLFLLLERLDAHLEAVDLLLEVLVGLVVPRLDEELADLAVHLRLALDVLQRLQGRLGLLELCLCLLFLLCDLLCRLLEVLELLYLLLGLGREVTLHTLPLGFATENPNVLPERRPSRGATRI